MIGPAVAGLVIVAVGTGWVFLLNGIAFLAMIAALLLMRRQELVPRVPAPERGRLADGFRYVRRRPDLMVTFAMVFLVGAFGMNFPIYASTMALEFGQEADGFGLLSSILAIGSLGGALLSARRETARIRVVIVSTLVFAAAAAASAAMPMAILLGGTPIGAPVVGWVAAEAGPRTAILLGAGAALVAFAVEVTWMLSSGRVHRVAGHRFRMTIDETTSLRLPPAENRLTPRG